MTPLASRNVLFVQTTSEIGGADVALVRMVRSLDPSRYRSFIALPAEGPLTDTLRGLGATVFTVPSMLRLSTTQGKGYYARYVLQYPNAIRQLAAIIRRERIDLVHSNTMHTLHGFAAALVTRRPHIWHLREIVLQSRAVGAVEKFLVRNFAARIIAMSSAIARTLDRRGRGTRRLVVLPDGVEIDLFHPRISGAGIRAELSIPQQHRVAGVVCRLDHWKGVDTFLRAAAICHQQLPDTTYVVAGGAVQGREEIVDRLHELAATLGIRECVRFTGWRYGPSEMPAVHRALDVLVLPSTWPEPYGLVVLEAMASGKPVIASRHGGPLEICIENETALFVSPGDAAATAEAMTLLLADVEHADAMGRAGRARVEQHFSYDRYIAHLQKVYDDVVSVRSC